MVRLTNDRTGVVVNVDDDTAERLHAGSDDWSEEKPETKKAPAKKAASSKSDSK